MQKPSEAGKYADGKLGNWLNEFKDGMSYFDDNEDQITGGSRYSRARGRIAPRRGYTEPANPPAVCDYCGATGLKWKWRDGWVLFDGSAAHQCNPTTADDFEALPDDCSDLV